MQKVFFALAVSMLLLVGASNAFAVDFWWDGDGLGTQDGGAGTWNTTLARWSTTDEGTTFAAWSNTGAATHHARFDDVAASVTVGTVSVNHITFSPTPSAAYILTGGTITFSGTNPTITVNTTGITNTTLTSVYTGSSQLTKDGAGRLELNASTNTLVGGYKIKAGFINLAAANRLGSGVTLPGTLDADWFVFEGGGLTTSNAAAQDLGATRGMTLGTGGAWFGASAAANPVTLSAPITGTGDITIATSTTPGSPLNGSFGSGGVWTLTNTGNNWVGNANVAVGGLTVGASGVIPDTSDVNLTGGTFALGAFNETIDTLVVNGSGVTVTGAGTLTGSSYDIRSSNTTTGVNVELGGGGSLTKTTGGTARLSAVNTYSGSTTISAGTLSIDGDSTLGNGAGTLNLSGGTLNAAADRDAVPVANPINVTANSAITTTSPAAAADMHFSSNSVVGTAGTKLTFRNDGADQVTDVFKPRFNGGGFNFASDMEISNGATGKTELSSFNAGGTQTFSGVISGNGSYNRSASVAGTGGTTIMTGANSYTGTTTVNDGILLVNGNSSLATGAVTVNSNGTLGGTGTVGGAVTLVGGTLAPGASPGTITLQSTLTFGNTSTYAYEYTPLSPVISDLTKVTGLLTIDNTVVAMVANVVNLSLLPFGPDIAMAPATKLALISYGSYNGGLFTLAGNLLADEEVFTIGANTFRIDYDDPFLSLSANGGTGTGVSLTTISAIPEASSILVMGLGGVFAIGLMWLGKRMGISVLPA